MLVAIVLIVISVVSIPLETFAATLSNWEEISAVSGNTNEISAEEPQIVNELTELREESAKHFILDDGTRMAVQYEAPVHFKDSKDNWVDYDNSLINADVSATPDEIAETEYTNKKSDFDVKIAKKSKENNMIKVTTDNYEISWGYAGVNKSKIQIINDTEELTGNEVHTVLKNATQEVLYTDVYKDVDIQCFINTTGVKENIVLKSRNAQKEFTINYKLNGLSAIQKDEKTIELKDSKNNLVYTISAPVMTDSAGNESEVVTLTIAEQKNNKLKVKIAVNENWVNAWERSFPVYIDPDLTIYQETNGSNIETANLLSNQPNTATGYGAYMYIIRSSGSTYNGVVKLNTLPELGAGDVVVSTSLNLYRYGTAATNFTINAHEITNSWTASTATWNNVTYDDTVIDYVTDSDSEVNYKSWDITKLAKKWYQNPSSNNGVLLTKNDVSSGQAVFFTGYQGIQRYKPIISIVYKNFKGTEPDQSYHTHPAGQNGEGSINDYTGNLVLTQNIFEGTGSRMPVTIKLTYNGFTHDKLFENGSPAGYGWQFSFNKYIRETNATLQDAGYHYIYTDEDGTEHYFKQKEDSTTEWEDEDGVGLTIVVDGNTIKMTGNSNNTCVYQLPANGGRLLYETDQYENQITYTYDNDGNLIKITDGAGREYTLTYSVSAETGVKRVTKITAPDGKMITILYSSVSGSKDLISRIIYPGNVSTTFGYYSNRRIGSVYAGNGTRVGYTYNTAGQVNSIKEYSSDSVLGNYLNIIYNQEQNTTVYTDKQGRSETYIFDNKGINTTVLNANGYIESTAMSDNKFAVNSGSDSHTLNYLGGLDDASSSNFVLSGTGTIGIDSSSELVNGEKTQYLGRRSIKVTNVGDTVQYFAQARHQLSDAAPLAGKTVTFSAYVKTSGIEERISGGSVGAILKLTAFNASGTTISETNSVGVSGTKGWQRISVTATMPTTTATIRIYCSIRNAEGIAWFDGMQLEESNCMNDYNALGNSDFSGSTSWNGSSLITGSPTLQKSLQQEVDVYKSNVAFNISGSVNGNSVPLSGNRKFGIKLKIYYTDSNIPVEEHYQEFSPWTIVQQAACLSVNPKHPSKEIQKVAFCFVNDYNANIMVTCNAMVNIGDYHGDEVIDIESANSVNGGEITLAEPFQGSVETTDSYGNVLLSNYGTVITDESGNETIDSSKPHITTQTVYDGTNNYVVSKTDARGKTTEFSVNAQNGQTNSVTDPKGNTTTYAYNSQNGKLLSMSGNGQAGNSTNNYQSNSTGALTVITHNNFGYNFLYDTFGNQVSTSVGTQSLITNNYTDNNKDIASTVYGNGDTISYTYDEYDRITKINGSNGILATYVYNKKGNPVNVTDNTTNTTTTYIYDIWGNVIKSITSNSTSQVIYEKSYVQDEVETISINGINRTVALTTDEEYRPVINNNGWTVSESIDELSRTEQIITSRGQNTAPFTRNFTYTTGSGANVSSELVATLTEKWGESELVQYGYKYDNNGNITTVTKGGATVATYTYDGLNQLVSVVDVVQRTYTTYSYDTAGNMVNVTVKAVNGGGVITSTISSVNYVYGDVNWKDKLTSYNGQNLTYDEVGNPLFYRDGMTMTWQNGRELKSITKDENTINYTYNTNGMRTQKSNNGPVTKYFYNEDNQLISMQKGIVTLMFYYDVQGKVNSLSYNGTKYYYIKNLQGDITAITTDKGTVVANYTYDAWGNILSISDISGNAITNQSSVALMNPFRYRGYVYDDDTGLYYLQSRYYDPLTCRFINADVFVDTGTNVIGTNMFAYCDNNPIMFIDIAGSRKVSYSWDWDKISSDKKVYVIYYSYSGGSGNFKMQAYNCYNYYANSSNTTIKGVDTYQSFITAWNKIPSGTQYVFILMHGGQGFLSFSNGTMSSFYNLNKKSIRNQVWLFSCSGGVGGKASVAAKITERLNNGVVLALTSSLSYSWSARGYAARPARGTVGYWKIFYYYYSRGVYTYYEDFVSV